MSRNGDKIDTEQRKEKASHKARRVDKEMSDEKNLFIPIFYSARETTASLDDEEFGQLIRELLASRGRKDYVPHLSANLVIAYNFMLDSAIRVFGNSYGSQEKARGKKHSQRELSPEEEAYVEETFRRAVERNYGNT